MEVFNITTQKFEDDEELCRVLISINEGLFELGYCSYDDPRLVECDIPLNNGNRYFNNANISYALLSPELENYIIYAPYIGKYIYKYMYNSKDLLKLTTLYGRGNFPYSIDREYEAVNCLNQFKGRQTIINKQTPPIAQYFKYSLGVEFETYAGYIPEHICFRDGLIPLRDGSLDGGIEYSTIVLNGQDGFNLLSQQIDTLNKYTLFNKECSLHFHFGNFPVTDKAIWALYLLWKSILPQISNMLPLYTFNTAKYKESGKDYCKQLPNYTSFFELYTGLAHQRYFGSLCQPHPKDPEKRAKWNINTRYYDLNLINMLCYNSPKTIEFRFLRPTYNKHKIYFWLYIFNAILHSAESIAEKCKDFNEVHCACLHTDLSIENILFSTYNSKLANKIIADMAILRNVVEIQNSINDYIGARTDIEDKFLNPNEIY